MAFPLLKNSKSETFCCSVISLGEFDMEQPKWADYMLSILNVISDGKLHIRNETIETVATAMGITEKLKSEVINSGQSLYRNRGGWALTYLKQAGLIESPKRGSFVLTNLGRNFLAKKPKQMTEKDLEAYPG